MLRRLYWKLLSIKRFYNFILMRSQRKCLLLSIKPKNNIRFSKILKIEAGETQWQA